MKEERRGWSGIHVVDGGLQVRVRCELLGGGAVTEQGVVHEPASNWTGLCIGWRIDPDEQSNSISYLRGGSKGTGNDVFHDDEGPRADFESRKDLSDADLGGAAEFVE